MDSASWTSNNHQELPASCTQLNFRASRACVTVSLTHHSKVLFHHQKM